MGIHLVRLCRCDDEMRVRAAAQPLGCPCRRQVLASLPAAAVTLQHVRTADKPVASTSILLI